MTAKIKKEKKSILLENTFLPFGVEMLFSWFIIVLFTMSLHLQTEIFAYFSINDFFTRVSPRYVVISISITDTEEINI